MAQCDTKKVKVKTEEEIREYSKNKKRKESATKENYLKRKEKR